MLTRDLSITTIQPLSVRCDYCSHQKDVDAEIDVNFLVVPYPLGFCLHLRTMGLSCELTTKGNAKLLQSLEYIHELFVTAHETSFLTIDVLGDDLFREHVSVISGGLQFMLAAGWSASAGASTGSYVLSFSRNPNEPSQRQLVAIEMLELEMRKLKSGKRSFTLPLETELPMALEEMKILSEEWESRNLIPSTETLHRWSNLYSFFRLLCASSSTPQIWEKHLLKCRLYCLYAVDKVRGMYHALELPKPLLSDNYDSDSLMQAYGEVTPSSTPIKSSQTAASPVCFNSPAEALIRTPSPSRPLEREEFCIAQPPTHQLPRDPDVLRPAGLLNLRQCCYMNSLLQAYYPILGPIILQAPCAASISSSLHKSNPNVKLVHRLQALFGYMAVSRISAINPSYVLDAVAEVHPDFRDQGQHDPQEFAQAFLEMLESGLQSIGDVKGRKQLENVVMRGECRERFVNWDGTVTSEERSTPVCHAIPLYFEAATPTKHRDPTDLLSVLSSPAARVSLDSALLDYIVEEKELTCSLCCVAKSFVSLASTILFHFPSRVSAASAMKADVAVEFPFKLDLTPYASSKKEAQDFRDQYIKAFAHERSLMKKLASAQSVLKQLQQTLANAEVGLPEHQQVMFATLLRGAANTVTELELRVQEAKATRESKFPFHIGISDPQWEYQVSAIIVHIGSQSGFGHYVSYVRDSDNDDGWSLYDDTTIKRVSKDVVFSLPIQRSVYCVLYQRVGDGSNIQQEVVPEYLRQIIDHEDMRKYDRIAKRLSCMDEDAEMQKI